ncbi:MAG: Crp/Fnr family transcriptional regulator, partial [Pseudomonadota bacterium]
MAPVHQIQTLQQSCEDCPIRNRAVCSYSTRDELAELNAAKFYRDYRAGSEIVGESELMSSLGSIVTGVVALQKTLEDGRRQMVGLLFPSDFIGRPLRSQAPYEAVAVTDVRMCMFQRQKFEQILRENVSLERRLLEITLDELDAARDWMLLLGRKTAREKIASFLMILARRARSSDGGSLSNGSRIQIPLSREAIAEYIGLTIETVSRQISG